VSEQWGGPEQSNGDWSIPQDAPPPFPGQGAEFGAPPQPQQAGVPPYGAPQQEFGDPTQQFGGPTQQFGAPPQYGVPQQGFGDPAYGYPVYGQQPAGSNGTAIAGFVLAFLFWPVGLVLSILGIRKSARNGGRGKGLAIAGVTISVLALFGTAGVIYIAASAPAADPGCTSAESQLNALNPKMTADENDPNALVADLTTAKRDLDSSVAAANHANVHDAIALTDSDLGTFIADYNSFVAQQGQGSVTADQIENDATKLQTDGDAVDSLCSTL
jgi:hypothetical protein